MSKVWRVFAGVALVGAALLMVAGCDSGNQPGSGGPTDAPPAGTNIPSAAPNTSTGTTPGATPGANLPGK